MTNTPAVDTMRSCWRELYDNEADILFDEFLAEAINIKGDLHFGSHNPGWYKDAIVYALYVDLFNGTFEGLISKLDYLRQLGVSCLWLLPILDSPMRDAGFDIRDYKSIRADLLGLPVEAQDSTRQAAFRHFLEEAHKRDIHVIFDIALNHTSEEHFWFRESRKSPDNPYRDYYIWNHDTDKFKETRLLFKGMCPSNWEADGDWFYFHRFFEFQPDLNYRNPKVLVEIGRILTFWLSQGVDGFRADAIPYVWKEDGTNCENLPKTHTIIRFIRALFEFVRPETLLLAEACQPPLEVVKYFGVGDECHAGYHFPLMPQIFKALAIQSSEPIRQVLHPSVTPAIADINQWFMFLRLHDELTLEMVTPEDRHIIHSHYCRDQRWDFRVGEGISARVADLFDHDPQKIGLAYSIMLSLPGTPVIYYGDEFGKVNDEEYYYEMKTFTGKDDTRFFVRGRVDWPTVTADLANKDSFAFSVNSRIRQLLHSRKKHNAFGRGNMEWIGLHKLDGTPANQVLSFIRKLAGDKILVVNNISESPVVLCISSELAITSGADVLGLPLDYLPGSNILRLPAWGYTWIKL
ncbi:MAG: alpha-amylase family glycosyl hydrolase [Bacteroidales bacterium]